MLNPVSNINYFLQPLQAEYVHTANNKIANAKFLLSSLPKGEEFPLVLNSNNRASLPRHFRECENPLIIPSTQKCYSEADLPSRVGLNALNASASAQPAEQEFQALSSHYFESGKKVIVVNLREESILFVNGHAISQFAASNLGNMGKSLENICKEEEGIINDLKNNDKALIYKIIAKTALDTLCERELIDLPIITVASEQELVCKAGLEYKRIPMTDHMRPNDKAVNAFVSTVKNRPNNSHFHFHCWEGHGRTTTVMVMLDAMQNANDVSFSDICRRQWWLGGEGSNMSNVPIKPNYKHELFDERFQFLSTFYLYCQENRQDGFSKTWTEYLIENGIDSF